jgi:membrane associated rhomboid family serine protease
MNPIIQFLKTKYNQGEMHVRLILINGVVFVALLLVSILIKALSPEFELASYVAAPSSFSEFLFQPWSIFTYMFAHSLTSIWHIVWNMVLLYFAGNIFKYYLGNKKMLSVYLAGGIVGYLFFALGYNLIPAIDGEGFLIGASAAVLAVFVAIGVAKPNMEIKIMFIPQPVKLVYIVGVFVVLDLIRLQSSMGVYGANTGGWLAHLGGTFLGAIYGHQIRQGKNILKYFEKFLDSLFSIDLGVFFVKKKSKMKVKRGGASTKQKVAKVNQKKIQDLDLILRKVKQSGYSSLTKEEKEKFFSQTK